MAIDLMKATPAQSGFAPTAGRLDALPRPSWNTPRRTWKTSHLLAADLRRQILSGELVADQRLPTESDLTAALEVSRETLREALRILESESLIEIRRGRSGGAVVRRPGLASVGRYVALLLQVRKATVADLEEARSVIEPRAALEVAIRASDDELDRLVALHDEERRAEGDPLSFATAVVAFDQAMTDVCGNRSIAVIAGVLRDIYAGQVYAAVGATDPRSAARVARTVVAGHSSFLDAALRRDATVAKEAWSDYLISTSRLVLRRRESRDPIDVTPLWTAQATRVGEEPTQRAAAVVATEVRCRIADGRLQDGDRLPPIMELAKEFGVSRPTLREALRILEMERLLDLRPGDRAGPSIRHPASDRAAQLAGNVLEAQQTTVADFARAVQLIEPAMIELAASRVSRSSLKTLRAIEADMAACVDDRPRFVQVWRDGITAAFASTRNPALAVVAEMLQWVRVGITATLTQTPEGARFSHLDSVRRRQAFLELVEAMATQDSSKARSVWEALVRPTAAYNEASELGHLLVVDLIG
ncbi:GntR family transcriptional regulator [Pseudofrankia sp. BMG5.37]|uniref:FadR/GntR family transcriptional regulator n=1 Tax=Pseudofrankia sp. BMG5.37 TaxID=3050035 RepID=UPI00289576AE|nr:GntR family transcriptional regulator [Pseudofrankia sp. BMG5.37]MDT3439266.1 GntR family transcriptional regulator [Pseudofrankia sp. BMG5.37]